MLSASTRNGATLNLQIGTIGYFSDGTIGKKTIPKVVEENNLDWHSSNEKLFDMYENVYLDNSINSETRQSFLNEISEQTNLIMTTRFAKYSV
jgi:hypothetical protein